MKEMSIVEAMDKPGARHHLFKPMTKVSIGVIPLKYSIDKVKYYIQRHTCPSAKCSCEILTCSCPSFQIQKPSKFVDSFHKPCKHIAELITIRAWKTKSKGDGNGDKPF